MARQNVRHAEATFSPGTHRLFGVASDVFLEGLRRGRAAVEREHGVSLRWIFDIVRNSDDIRAEGDFVTSLAIEMKGEGVVALGLGGMEAGRPPEPFAPWFERAKSAGLASTPHAGETAGPESVWGAIRALGADRIGHGVRAIEDPALVEHLAERRIPLEICPTSNLRLGVCRSYEEHPMKRLIEAGCVVTIDSDDPPLFNTTGPLGLNRFQAREVILNGARCAFLPAESRARLASELGQAGRPR
jgi:adenosine deaminase